jgi:hypothetical protein
MSGSSGGDPDSVPACVAGEDRAFRVAGLGRGAPPGALVIRAYRSGEGDRARSRSDPTVSLGGGWRGVLVGGPCVEFLGRRVRFGPRAAES